MKIKGLQYDFVALDTIGDGSCFLHAVLQAFNNEYRQRDLHGRIQMVRELRIALSKVFDEKSKNNRTFYQNLSRGEIEELSKIHPQLRKDFMIKYLKSGNWINFYFLEYISELLDINIIIVSQKEKDFYYTGDNEIYIKKRDSVFINYIDQAHFETLGVKTPSGIRTLFPYDSEEVKKSLKKLKEKNED